MSIRASIIVADDVLVSMNGKMYINGVYTNDIILASNPAPIGQMVFIFHIEGDADSLPRSLRIGVKLPGEEAPRIQDIAVPPEGFSLPPGRKTWGVTLPLPVSPGELRVGKIEARVITDKEEIEVAAPWITIASSGQPHPS